MTDERIDLSQFEKITHGKWSVIRNGGRIDIGVGDSYSYAPIITFTDSLAEVVMKIDRDVADMNAIAATPELIAELKRCYEEIDKMQHSIVKNIGDCWVCDMPIDSCDARSCGRQMLEDIELGTASE
jgi:hypothetical protein